MLFLAACGRDLDRTPAPPLGPEHYVIEAEDVPQDGEHLRYAKASRGKAGGLDIAITEFRHPDGGPTVALVGVVHVADPHYFDVMQAELDRYEVVLYEGVKPEHQTDAEWQQSFTEGGDAAQLQRDLAGWFGFEYQLDAIDYTRENFVHADMSLEDFVAAGGAEFMPGIERKAPKPVEKDDETTDDDDATPQAPAPASDAADAEMVEQVEAIGAQVRSTWSMVKAFGDVALGKPGPLRSMARKMFAETMGTTDIGRALEMRPGFSQLILIDRNKVVMERLKQVLPTTKASIAIFYGAAHMDDLQERLLEELGYERTGGRWLRAWAIRPPLR